MRSVTAARSVRVAVRAVVLGVGISVSAAPIAAADPVIPVEPGVPAAEAAPAAAPAAQDVPAVVAQAAAPAPVTPPDGVDHLPSPDSLPPGTTQTAPDHPTLGYLKDVWKALRTEEVSAGDALLLLAQRPVNDTKVLGSVPQNQTGPAGPPAPAAPAAEAPVPAPAG